MTFTELRWGLLLISEEGYGRSLRTQQAHEDDQMRSARAALGG